MTTIVLNVTIQYYLYLCQSCLYLFSVCNIIIQTCIFVLPKRMQFMPDETVSISTAKSAIT